jgi:hypothetical protein
MSARIASTSHRIGRLQRAAPNAGLAVDPHADLHLALGQLEGRPTGGGHDALIRPRLS